jgi:hypothetical protein
MTITFENDNDIIVYALEKVISYARRTQQIFVAQCIWWLASIIGLEQGLANYIDNIQSRVNVTIIPEKVPISREPISPEKVPSTRETVSPVPRNNQDDSRQDYFLKECEGFLRESRKLRDIISLKAEGITPTGRINPTPISKKYLRKKDRYLRKQPAPAKEESKCLGIEKAEIQRRKATGECLRCAWPADRKGTHQVKDCRRPAKLDKGTALFSKVKADQKLSKLFQQSVVEESRPEEVSSEVSSDDLL